MSDDSSPKSPGPKVPGTLREELEAVLDEAEWSWMAPHLARDAVILVAHGLDLLTVGEKIARDDKVSVQSWISSGQLSKPTREQIEAWTKTPGKKFLTLIVQPYVLVQEHLLH
jgi:hypothetical protein